MEAIKTEYKKDVFDSKSEAVFARALHLSGNYYSYHPHSHCGHVWDFSVWGRAWMPSILVEYKPKMPTNTYVDNLTEQMRANPVESIVVWGNPWDGFNSDWPVSGNCSYVVYPIFTKWGKFGWGDFMRLADNGSDLPMSYRHDITEMFGITEDIVQEAKNYRFDLTE